MDTSLLPLHVCLRKKREEQSEHCRFTAQHIEQCLQQWREEVDAHTKHAGQTAQLAAKVRLKKFKAGWWFKDRHSCGFIAFL